MSDDKPNKDWHFSRPYHPSLYEMVVTLDLFTFIDPLKPSRGLYFSNLSPDPWYREYGSHTLSQARELFGKLLSLILLKGNRITKNRNQHKFYRLLKSWAKLPKGLRDGILGNRYPDVLESQDPYLQTKGITPEEMTQ